MVVAGRLVVVRRGGGRGLPASGVDSTEALGTGSGVLALGAGAGSLGAAGTASETEGGADGASLSDAGFFEIRAMTTTATAASTTINTTGTIQRGRR